MKRLLDVDPLTGETVWFEDTNDGYFQIRHEQAVEALLDHNKKLANDTDRTKKGIKEDWWHYGSVPNIVLQEWSLKVGGNILSKEHEKDFFRFLNSPEYAYLRTTHGKHAPTGR